MAKRISWPLGKVVELIKGKDGIVRLVKVCTKQGELAPVRVSKEEPAPVPVSLKESAPVPVSQEVTSPVPVSPEDLLPTSQPRLINRYGRTLRTPHRLEL
ncbi:hypothetical protein HNY73_009956 [Argiope bruennichi]|uniref:DUF5641 domain-containing protein n=2 Tax=Argiope bruennichi TaxID=94029 RepID=A0A8T0F198_ARGBR|nr:hypothetical protein HNY73_009956 [Argiope bruennichi]